MDQQYCLHWKDHQNTLVAVLGNLLMNERMIDVTLSAEGKVIGAHRVILSACSQYFENILSSCENKHPVIFLKDVKFDELRCLINYIYKGEVNVSQDKLPSLIKVAESLKIRGLTEDTDKKINIQSNYSQSEKIIRAPSNPNIKKKKVKLASANDVANRHLQLECNDLYSKNDKQFMSSHRAVQVNEFNQELSNPDMIDVGYIKKEYPEMDDFGYLGDQMDSNNEYYSLEKDQSIAEYWNFNIGTSHLQNRPNIPPEMSVCGSLYDGIPTRFPCPKCGRMYKFKKNLFRHLKHECGVENQHQCPLCQKKFRRKGNLASHMSVHGIQISSCESKAAPDSRIPPSKSEESSHEAKTEQS